MSDLFQNVLAKFAQACPFKEIHRITQLSSLQAIIERSRVHAVTILEVAQVVLIPLQLPSMAA
jgi:uncharacterized protein involved in propanediol utilization